MPSPPPRRLSRSSIDLRDLELQHEKLSHTDSAPDIVGLDKYLKSSDSEPLHFQQQLRQQLLFQEQIQQQYYLGSRDSKAKQLRQNSLKKINNFLQPFFFPGSAHKRNDDEGREDEEEDQEQDLENRDGLERIKSNGSLGGDVDAAGEMDTLNKFNEPAPGTTITTTTDDEETKRLSTAWAEDEESFGVLYSPAKSTNFYVNFYNEKIALGPHRDQYVKVPNYGGALSESDFLTIKDIEHELLARSAAESEDNHQEQEQNGERESRAKRMGLNTNTVADTRHRRRWGRRRSSSCEEIPTNKRGAVVVEGKRNDKEGEEEQEASAVVWKNFANKSRFGATLQKFNSSSRLLVGSIFGDRSAHTTTAKYRHFRRIRNAMLSMDETSSCAAYRSPRVGECEGNSSGSIVVETGDAQLCPVNTNTGDTEDGDEDREDIASPGEKVKEPANQLTIKPTDEQLMASKTDLIKHLICKSSKSNGNASATTRTEEETVQTTDPAPNKRSGGADRQRMRVFSDGNCEKERVIDNEDHVQRNKRPRVLSEGHESNSVRGLLFVRGATEHEDGRVESTASNTATSSNDTPDILMGLMGVAGGADAKQLLQQLPMIDLGVCGDSVDEQLQDEEIMHNEDTPPLDRGLLMDISGEEQKQFIQTSSEVLQPSSLRGPNNAGKGSVGPSGNLSIVDQELLRAISNVTPVSNTLDVVVVSPKELIVPLVNGDATQAPPTCKGTGTKPEIVLDSTLSLENNNGHNNAGGDCARNGKVQYKGEESGGGVGEKLTIAGSKMNASLVHPNASNTRSPSALLKRDENGMRLRQASVVTYDVNVINFGGPDDCSASDNYNYHVNGSFSSAAGQSNLQTGRQSTSSASKFRSNWKC